MGSVRTLLMGFRRRRGERRAGEERGEGGEKKTRGLSRMWDRDGAIFLMKTLVRAGCIWVIDVSDRGD